MLAVPSPVSPDASGLAGQWFTDQSLGVHLQGVLVRRIGLLAARFEANLLGPSETLALIDEHLRAARILGATGPLGADVRRLHNRLLAEMLDALLAPNSNSNSKEEARAEDEITKTKVSSNSRPPEAGDCSCPGSAREDSHLCS